MLFRSHAELVSDGYVFYQNACTLERAKILADEAKTQHHWDTSISSQAYNNEGEPVQGYAIFVKRSQDPEILAALKIIY